MNKLQNYLNDYVQKLDGDWSYLICNLKNSQETICLNGNHLHKSASMIKVLILATLCASDLDFNEKILMDDAVVLPIYYTTQPYIAQPYVKNYRWSILGTIDFKEAYIENSPEKASEK